MSTRHKAVPSCNRERHGGTHECSLWTAHSQLFANCATPRNVYTATRLLIGPRLLLQEISQAPTVFVWTQADVSAGAITITQIHCVFVSERRCPTFEAKGFFIHSYKKLGLDPVQAVSHHSCGLLAFQSALSVPLQLSSLNLTCLMPASDSLISP